MHADNAYFVAPSVEDLQLIRHHFSTACEDFRLAIAKVMFTSPPDVPYKELTMFLKNTMLEVIDTSPCLGSTIFKDGAWDAEIISHIQKECVAFGKLESSICSNRSITIKKV